jgi:hypothetical protein
MALIGNYTLTNRVIGRQFNSASTAYGVPETIATKNSLKNRYYGAFSKLSATPNGYNTPTALVMAQVAGGMSSYKNHSAKITENLTAVAGFPISSSISALGQIINANLGLIVALESVMSASGSFTNAQIAASVSLASSMSASGAISSAELGAIVSMAVNMQAQGTLNATTLVGVFMEWSVGGPEALSPQGLANAVWNAASVNYNDSGTMAKELKDKLGLSDYIGLS